VKVRYLLERGRALNSSKKPAEAMPLFEQAWDLAREIGEPGYAVDAAHMCAIATPKPEDKRAWNLKAIEYAEESGDKRALAWLGALYNNMGWDYHDEGAYEKALDMQRRCEKWHAERGEGSRGHLIARWSVAKQLRMLKRYDEAMKIQRDLEGIYEKKGKGGQFVDEEIAEILYATGKAEEAKPYFKKAYEVLKDIRWVAEDKERIARLKKLAGD
jgi:tetratricopeptide (TPR) repeat protein